jgi:hypothetical protein
MTVSLFTTRRLPGPPYTTAVDAAPHCGEAFPAHAWMVSTLPEL